MLLVAPRATTRRLWTPAARSGGRLVRAPEDGGPLGAHVLEVRVTVKDRTLRLRRPDEGDRDYYRE